MSSNDLERMLNESSDINLSCRKCKAEFTFEDGTQYALKYGIRDRAVVCPKCNSVYEVNITSHGMTILDDISIEHPQIRTRTLIVASNKLPIVAALLSLFLFGGTGQIYLGQWKKGLVMVLVTLSIMLFTIAPLSSIGILIIGMADAYATAKKLNDGYPVGEWEFNVKSKLVILLAIMSAVAGCVITLFLIYLFMGE